MNPPLLYAHRGAAAEHPENTLVSFARALEYGVDVLEMDVHMTLDGHIVVSHDPTGLRRAGIALEIRRCTLADIKSWDVGNQTSIPTLDEVLGAFPDTRLNVDVKQQRPDMTRPVIDLVRRHGAEERVLLASFYSATLRRLRALGYRGPTSLGREEALALLTLPLPLLRRLPRVAQRAQLPARLGRLRLLQPRVIARCHALGLACDFWTINEPAEARLALELGADGVMTDHPARIAPVVAAYRAARGLTPRGTA